MNLNKLLAFLAGLVVGIAFGYIVWGAPTPAQACVSISPNDCQERTVTRHQDWIVDGHWTCPNGWELYWSTLSNEWRCKKNLQRQDATWTDTSHWGNWSNWATNSCTPSQTKNCESKVQHQTSCGQWVDGNCPQPTPTPSLTPTPIPPTPTPYHSLCREYACIQVEGEGDNECKVDEDCQPEVTPIPTEAPKETPFPQPCNGCGEEPKAPMCSEPAPVVQPRNFGCYRNGVMANCMWVPGDEGIADIFYSEGKVNTQPDTWPHALVVDYSKYAVKGQADILGLQPGVDYSFALRSRNACSNGQFVYQVVVDSDGLGVYFPMTYWYIQ